MQFNATFIVTIITFIIFVLLMNKILYVPILNIMQKRKKFIDENYNEANSNSDISKSILEDKKEKISQAKLNAKEKFSQAVDIYKEEKNKKINMIKQQAKEELNNRKKEYEKASNEAKETLKSEIINLAQIISDKFLKEKEKINEIDENLIKEIMQG